MNDLTPHELWSWLIPGYLFTVAVETPVLLVGLSPPHSWWRRIVAGVWLNACSYPIVVIAMPALLGESHHYADLLFSWGARTAPASTLVSTIKLRQAGFGDCEDTEVMFAKWLRRLVDRGVLPPP